MGIFNLKITILITIILLVGTGSVIAFGVSSPYWDKNPLEMYPGQVKEIEFTLVNKPNAETANAVVELKQGEQIAEISSGKNYVVAPGSKDTKVILKISVPETAQIGHVFDVKFTVKAAPENQGGTVQLGIGYNVDFPVKIVEEYEEEIITPEEPKSKISWLTWLIAIVIVLVIAYLFLRRKR
ncbi:MAG: hypothetical protein KKF48_00630 [Nanoarchaeota archaeon]|nr:hypothetical protein [Nanoarchaeota archaeon]MBU1027528.1 hypothetical protein [Nanoarchaeota archaeon]